MYFENNENVYIDALFIDIQIYAPIIATIHNANNPINAYSLDLFDKLYAINNKNGKNMRNAYLY